MLSNYKKDKLRVFLWNVLHFLIIPFLIVGGIIYLFYIIVVNLILKNI
jgi:hypothetical protein